MTKSASPISCRIARPVLIALIAAATALFFSPGLSRAAAPDFAPATFKVLTPGTSTVIGQAHFNVTEEEGGALIVGSDARYTSGETDSEEDHLEAPVKGGLPHQISFSHIEVRLPVPRPPIAASYARQSRVSVGAPERGSLPSPAQPRSP